MSEPEFPVEGSLSLQPIEELEHPLMLKDRWHGEEDLGLRVNDHIGRKTIYFGNIKQPWFKCDVKRYILYRRSQGIAFSTLFNHAQNIGSFAKFLEEYSVYSFDDINDEILSAYESSLFRLAKGTKRRRLICLRCFFDIGSLNNWFNISTYFFQGKSARVKPNHNEIKYIPEIVLKQLDDHLSELPEQTQRIIVLFRTLGLRASELFQIKFDCLRQRKDGNGKLWHFTNSQLRDTRLTYLFETGHEFTVVSKWAGHKKFETTQKYIHVKDHTLRDETASIQAALFNIRGEPLNPKDLPATLQSNPNAHTLAIPDDHINTPIYGYCGLSLDQDCPHWKACYTCPSFIARRELLPDYIKVRDLLRDKQARAEDKGETALIDQFKQQADSLDTVIDSFERAA